MKPVVAIALASSLLACDGAHRIGGPPALGIVEVSLQVTGDTTLSRAQYPLVIDEMTSHDIVPGKVTVIELTEGTHAARFDGTAFIKVGIDLGPLLHRPPAACTIANSGTHAIHVYSSQTALIEYRIDCPLRSGLNSL